MSENRKKIPVWAMVALSILPLWAFMYVLALKPVDATGSGPLRAGAGVYTANCGYCHGDAGQGAGTGYPFANGAVLNTFPRIEDQLRWVSLGTKAYQSAGVDVYGSPTRDGAVHVTGASGGVMPGWSISLSDAEIVAVVCHERYDLGGADASGVYADEFVLWCAPDAPIYAALQSGEVSFADVHVMFAADGVIEVGAVPMEGRSG